jgi:putative Ca2+/H+ antiporter (TMEM165/GDT1 family)
MSIEHVLRAFATVFPAELPDKTMIATIVLVARYRRPLAVWLGAVIAFTVHVIVAVAAGSALSLLPDVIVKSVVAAMFLAGAVLLFRAARSAQANVDAAGLIADASTRSAIVGSFGLVVLAEWGDLTQLATASLAATSGDPAGTGIGALVALASVAAIAAGFGRQLVARVPLHRVNYVGATVFAALAVWTLVELVRSSA